MAHPNSPDAAEKVYSRDKGVSWYSESVGTKLEGPARELLEKYSKIPPEEVENHVYKIVWLSFAYLFRSPATTNEQ